MHSKKDGRAPSSSKERKEKTPKSETEPKENSGETEASEGSYKKMIEALIKKEGLEKSRIKTFTEEEARERMELNFVECQCGFHFGLDNTFVDQVEDFKIICPACSRYIDTADIE